MSKQRQFIDNQIRKKNEPFVPLFKQSIPKLGFFSAICLDLTSETVLIGEKPLFSANAIGTDSKASANARIAYCSIVAIYSK